MLLINVRENFIRLEARYLFIFLVGQSAMLVFGTLSFIYGAINSVIGSTANARMEKVETKLRYKIVEIMNAAIEVKDKSATSGQTRDRDDNKIITFCPFDGKVTKK